MFEFLSFCVVRSSLFLRFWTGYLDCILGHIWSIIIFPSHVMHVMSFSIASNFVLWICDPLSTENHIVLHLRVCYKLGIQKFIIRYVRFLPVWDRLYFCDLYFSICHLFVQLSKQISALIPFSRLIFFYHQQQNAQPTSIHFPRSTRNQLRFHQQLGSPLQEATSNTPQQSSLEYLGCLRLRMQPMRHPR